MSVGLNPGCDFSDRRRPCIECRSQAVIGAFDDVGNAIVRRGGIIWVLTLKVLERSVRQLVGAGKVANDSRTVGLVARING
jgi:hypothetical protein